MSQLPDLAAGVWQHYKGQLYLPIGYGHDANADELIVATGGGTTTSWADQGGRDVAVYVPLQLDGAHTGPRMAVRTASDFHARVCDNTECVRYGRVLTGVFGLGHDSSFRVCRACESRGMLRFTYLGPSYEGPT